MSSAPVPVTNPKRTIYIGGFDENVNADLLRAAFIPFGDILQVNIPVDRENKHKGFGFIEYELAEDAMAAVDNMHNAELWGKVISCSVANPASVQTITKPVWADDSYIQQGLKPDAQETDENAKEASNAPKLTLEELEAKSKPLISKKETIPSDYETPS